ncbi:MAG: DUF2087 domain-containing protein [Clostridia bacterium]
MREKQIDIARFLDENGRLKQLPSKSAMRKLAHAYIAGKFEYGVNYTEHEVNAIISQWHTFDDYFVLRRGLVEDGYLRRVPDGSRYWRNEACKAGEDD